MKKPVKILITVLVIVGVLTGASFWYVNDYYHAKDTQDALADTKTVRVQDMSYGYFVDGPGEDTALVFYPGAKVEDISYLPMLKEIAAGGMDCFLVKMPGNLAVLGANRAQGVIDQYDYDHWYIGGHSLGGAMAASFAAKHTDELDGLVLLAAYSTKDLSQSGLMVLSIYGSEDQVLNREKYEQDKTNLPDDTQEYVIKGGNHAGFGDYGAQKGDGTATISAEDQQDLAAEKTLEACVAGYKKENLVQDHSGDAEKGQESGSKDAHESGDEAEDGSEEPHEGQTDAAAGYTETDLLDWDEGDVFGVVYLGGADTFENVLAGTTGQAAVKAYPSLEGHGVDVDMQGDEYYAILPRYKGQTFSFYPAEVNPDTGDYEDSQSPTVEIESDGSIIVLHCNVSDLYSNTAISATYPDQAAANGIASISWHPYLSLRDGQVVADVSGVRVRNVAPLSVDDVSYYWENLLGWGGSAGSSLKTQIAAVSLLEWASSNGIYRYEGTEPEEAVRAWYDGLSDDQKQNFQENMESVFEAGDAILDGTADEGLLSDSGVSEQAQELRGYDGIPQDWLRLKKVARALK